MGNPTGHIKYRKRIRRIMRESSQPMSSNEIMSELMIQPQLSQPHRTYTNTPTRSELSNILSTFREFERVSKSTYVSSMLSGEYKVALWKLIEEE